MREYNVQAYRKDTGPYGKIVWTVVVFCIVIDADIPFNEWKVWELTTLGLDGIE